MPACCSCRALVNAEAMLQYSVFPLSACEYAAVPPAVFHALIPEQKEIFSVCILSAEPLALFARKPVPADILQLALAYTHSTAADRSQQPNGNEAVGSQAGLPGSEPPHAHNHPSLPLYELQL